MSRLVLALIQLALLAGIAPGQAIDEQLRQLESADPDVRRLAAEALGKQKAARAIPALVERLKDSQLAVVKAATAALVRIGPEAMPALAGVLRLPDANQRLRALSTLARLADKTSTPPPEPVVVALLAALKDDHTDVRIHAAVTLGRLKTDRRTILPALFAVAGDTSNLGDGIRAGLPSSVAEAAIPAALALDPQCGPALAKAALPGLTAALRGKDQNAVRSAGYALSGLGAHAQAVLPALREARKTAKGSSEWAIDNALNAIDPDVLKPLFETIRNPKADLDKRLQALSKLGWERRSKENIDAVLVEALGDADPRVRVCAAEAIGRLGLRSKASLQRLLELLGDEELDRAASQLRLSTLDVVPEALAKFGTAAVPGLVAILKDEKKPPLARFKAARALSGLKRKASDALATLAAATEDRLAVIAVESACAYVRAGGDVDKVVPLFRAALLHQSTFVLWTTAYAIERVGAPAQAVAASLKPLLSNKDREVRIMAARAVSRLGAAARPIVPALAELLETNDPRQQHQVENALKELGPDARGALPVLIARLKNLSPSFPNPVLEAIGNLGGDGAAAVPALRQLLNEDKDKVFGDEVVKTLGHIGPAAKAAIPDLLRRLELKEEYARAAAAKALGQIGAKEAVGALKKRLTDEKKNVRVWTAFALARLTGEAKTYLEHMVEWWEEDDEQGPFSGMVRFDLSQAFALLGSDARPALDVLLTAALDLHTPPGTHDYVTRTLGQLTDDSDKVVPRLLELLDQPNPKFDRANRREHAIAALVKHGAKAKPALDKLRQLSQDEDDAVAEAAARALAQFKEK